MQTKRRRAIRGSAKAHAIGMPSWLLKKRALHRALNASSVSHAGDENVASLWAPAVQSRVAMPPALPGHVDQQRGDKR
jgi:hypothetical protein